MLLRFLATALLPSSTKSIAPLFKNTLPFLRPQLLPTGEEAARIGQQLGRFAPCQVQAGLMYLASDQTHYRPAWKGAFLMTWKSLWPMSLIRRALFNLRMQKELKSLQSDGAINMRTA